MPRAEFYQRIRAEIEDIALIDTHEHLMSEATRLQQRIDLFCWLAHYACSDLVSAGMPEPTLRALRDTDKPLEERWTEFAPFWGDVRSTGYGRALLLAARDLFDVEDINETTYQELSDKITAANRSGWYEYVLKERANIDLSILDPLFDDVDPTPLNQIDRRFFAPVLRLDDFLTICDRHGIDKLECGTDVSIFSLDDVLTAMDVAFQRSMAAGIVGVKVAVAYERALHFERVACADAERVFNRMGRFPVSVDDSSQSRPPVSWMESKPLQDYLMHQAVRRAIEADLPIQVHTGLQEGNGNAMINAHPSHLVSLLIEYPKARFDLFHSGYPFQSEVAALVKNFRNAYVDLCWLHAISPWVARQTLHEFIETVPANKIFAFGGDYIFVEGAYAHARMARENVAAVLAEKVAHGYLTETEAIGLAQKLLRDNAARFFRLPV